MMRLCLCPCGCGGGPCVPQRPYVPAKLEAEEFGDIIYFSMGDRCGITIAEALEGHCDWLIGRDEQVLVEGSTSISLRFEVSLHFSRVRNSVDL